MYEDSFCYLFDVVICGPIGVDLFSIIEFWVVVVFWWLDDAFCIYFVECGVKLVLFVEMLGFVLGVMVLWFVVDVVIDLWWD